MSYINWRKRLEIAKLPTVAARRAELTRHGLANMEPTQEDEGYYRIPQTQKDPGGNGKNIITGWVPVALWFDGGLVGVKGTEQTTMHRNDIVDAWTWFCAHPITYETYLAVAERGEPWPDSADATWEKIKEENNLDVAGTRLAENQPPADEVKEELPAHIRFANAVDAAISAAATLVVDSAEADAVAVGSKNRIAELRLAGEKIGKARYEPMHMAYVAERDRWLKPINAAVFAEKAINTKVLTFRESERKRLAAIAETAAREQREREEATERAAQRAIAAGTPEPPPVVVAEPVLVQPAAPAPTYGKRQVKSELKKFAIIEQELEVFKFFQSNEELQALLEKLATNAIRSGLTVPGATFREGLV